MNSGLNTAGRIVHICSRQDWLEAIEAGIYRPDSLTNEGFIHCSLPEQVLIVVNRLYKEEPDLVLLWIEPESVRAEIRWETVDGEVYPHIYGPIDVETVSTVQDLIPDEDGFYRSLPSTD